MDEQTEMELGQEAQYVEQESQREQMLSELQEGNKNLQSENKRQREALEHIAENGCGKCGNVAEQALQDIDPNYEAMIADLTSESPK